MPHSCSSRSRQDPASPAAPSSLRGRAWSFGVPYCHVVSSGSWVRFLRGLSSRSGHSFCKRLPGGRECSRYFSYASHSTPAIGRSYPPSEGKNGLQRARSNCSPSQPCSSANWTATHVKIIRGIGLFVIFAFKKSCYVLRVLPITCNN